MVSNTNDDSAPLISPRLEVARASVPQGEGATEHVGMVVGGTIVGRTSRDAASGEMVTEQSGSNNFAVLRGSVAPSETSEMETAPLVAPWIEATSRWNLAMGSQQLPPQVLAQLPPTIRDAGPQASYRFFEFFSASIRNYHTRRAYAFAVGQFFAWCEAYRLPLEDINSVVVATYIETLPGSIPTTKQHLAALRRLFDHLVVGHILPVNPAAAVRGPRYSVKKGKTPVLNGQEAQHLLDSIDTSHLIGLRDRALIGLMIYSFARIGAAVHMNVGDYYGSGKRWWVRLHEKGGKRHEVPVHHQAEEYLDAYLLAAGISEDKKGPLFRTTRGRSGTLTENRLRENDALRMIKRRALAAGMSSTLGCHSCRATGITAYLSNGGTLERAQQIANHESPKTTKLYDRTNDQITVDEIERIRLD